MSDIIIPDFKELEFDDEKHMLQWTAVRRRYL